ncbi:MAG: hypothetical protein D6729_03380 [Deltaproteobacteria bacterium]|nr:MAG: hypothetical protein D6729_03380 [Deltaproteobacteria bacterium]
MHLSPRATSLLLAVALAACATPHSIRDLTYPKDIRYYSRHELKTVMGRMAKDVSTLDDLLRRDAPPPDTRARIVALLRDIEENASQLYSPGALTNHPRIERNIGSFLKTVTEARRAAERDPPNYYLAGNLIGACVYCHAQPDLPSP